FAKIKKVYLGDLIPYLPNSFHRDSELHFENIKELHYVNTDLSGLLNNFVGLSIKLKN
ncbi:18294_t:CDS:1, partial [Entrophospora sp. SA101]